MSYFLRFFSLLPLCLMACSCSSAATPDPTTGNVAVQAAPESHPIPGIKGTPAETWKALRERLVKDGLPDAELASVFSTLGAPSQDPMGRKIQELYTTKFLRPTKPTSTEQTPDVTPNTTGIPRPWYKGFVTDENARRCRTFIAANAKDFQAAQDKYGVPKEVAVALLFVETRLGDYMGDQNALITLASMSVSRSPDNIPVWLAKLPGVEQHLDWVTERMNAKADWAYDELKALLVFAHMNKLDPNAMPCSAYGAIGLCQFMPSNLDKFAVDGNGDQVVNLFVPADAVASLCNYLAKNGWKPGMTVPMQIKVLRRYNNLAIYANTILALASKIRDLDKPVTAKPVTAKPTTAKPATPKPAAPKPVTAKPSAPKPAPRPAI